jgi:DNA-nicking Smr family endonuclease
MAPRSKSPPFRQRPFAGLDQILSKKDIHIGESSEWVRRARQAPAPVSAADEKRLFNRAMADVRPLRANRHVDPHARQRPSGDAPNAPFAKVSSEDAEGLRRLRELVEEGKGFTLAYTAEYMAGPDGRCGDHLSEALHQGRYTIQDHIDLHGMRVSEAEAALEAFFRRSVATGKRGLLIVHGRGLRSTAAPVLKRKVRHWLTRGPWRRWVVAFASAQACDGGTGATYVLIRNTPGKKTRP